VPSRYRATSRRRPIASGVARDDDPLDALLAALGHPDDEWAAASAERRRHRQSLRQLAAQSSTLAGVLLTLAERGDAVALRCGPWAHGGRLRSVTESLAILEGAAELVLLPTASITAVRAETAVADDRLPPTGPDLATVLAALAGEHPRVRLQLGDGNEVAGTLLDLGKDVARVQQASGAVIVRLSALAACVLPSPESAARPGGAAGAQDNASGVDLTSLDDLGSG